MATEVTNKTIVDLLNEVNPRGERWTVENVSKLGKNLQVLKADFSRIKGLLIQFQSREKRLTEPVKRCLQKIEAALREALNLIDESNQQQERGWRLPYCNPLSSKNRVWKTRFDALLQELEGPNKIIVKVLNEGLTIENVNNLENSLQVLDTDFSRMKGLLIQTSNQFQSQEKRLPEPVVRCLPRIKDALLEALSLIDDTNRQQERGWCLPRRNPSSKNRVWKTRFDALLQELELAISISSNTEQIVPRSQRLLQALPDLDLVGRAIQSAWEQLQKWLEESPRKGRKIGVYGRSGVGKTSLLKIIYNYYKKEVSGFFDVFIWVTVSRSFEIEQLQDSIAEALNLSLEGISTAETRKMNLNASLERKRFLLILDNMSNEIDLNEVGVNIGDDNGSKLLVSSRNREVVEKMGAKDFLEIKPLSSEEGWKLFRRGALADEVVAGNIETIAKNISSLCRGLPLAINAVAATMSCEKTQNDWQRALKFMESTDTSFQRSQTNIEAELYQQLRWCFNDLSDSHLQKCFLSCAAFLGDKEIPVETLVQMWDAEGLIDGAETPYLMDAGRHCIKVLVSRFLLESVEYIVDDDYHTVEYLKIHEALREMAIYIGSQDQEKCLFLAGQKLQNFPGEGDTRDRRRISVGHTAIKDLPNDLKCSKLESLVLASNNQLEKIPERFFSDIKSLKVLDLSNTSIGTLPVTVQQLQQLKFLNLARCTKLVDLPDSLCTLSNLQVLNLSSCLALRSLPSQIGKLKNLKHLKLDACYSLNELPKDLFQLTSLNTLILPLMESVCAVSVEDLSKLSNLTELTTVVTSENLTELTTVVTSENKVDTEVAWLEMRNLTLEYDADADAERDCVAPEHVILQKMGHMKKLQNFHLINYQGETLPNSICEFQNMKMLLLHSCYQLKALPALDKNRSESADDRSDSAGYSFPILEILVLRNLLKLESLAGSSEIWNEGTMSKLQFLVISNCPLKKLPSGMKLPYLKELHISMCNELMELDIGSDGFPMLEMLTLDELNKLERIADPATVWNEGTMSKLQILEVIDCPLLKTLPKGIEKLSNLKQINGELDWWQRISWPDGKLEIGLGKLFMIV